MDRNRTRSTRLEARLSPETLAMVKRAAEIEGRSVSDFAVAYNPVTLAGSGRSI
jgi:uncharacterized protein (DUF1778 family)